ncbi:hypothetical protein REPUB_Repub08aG0013700 [Reevesia pubescens]
MQNDVATSGVCSSESVNGSRDVWSCKDSDSLSADHLVIMVHGILGSSSDWKFGAEQFVKRLPDKVFVHCSERNMSKLTLDGVDVMGERLAKEVLDVIQEKPNLRKISFVAHFVGGLVARYAIGRLYRPPKEEVKEDKSGNEFEEDTSGNECKEEPRGTIGGLEAVNFITVATPHLGSRGNKQVPFLFGVPAFEKAASCVIHLIFRRTGRHLFLNDDDEGKPPLLKRMLEDYDEFYFMSALRLFKRRVLYSNVAYDHIVGWRTSSIRRDSELPKWDEYLNEKYPHIMYEEHCKAYDADQYETISTEDDGSSDKLEEELVRGLPRVSWKKIDVSFHSSRQRSAAHSVIQKYISYARVKYSLTIDAVGPSSQGSSKTLNIDGVGRMALQHVETFVISFYDPQTFYVAAASLAPTALAPVAEAIRIPEAGHLRCSLPCLGDDMQCTIQASFKMQVQQGSYVLQLPHHQPLFKPKFLQKLCFGTLSTTMKSQVSCADSFYRVLHLEIRPQKTTIFFRVEPGDQSSPPRPLALKDNLSFVVVLVTKGSKLVTLSYLLNYL